MARSCRLPAYILPGVQLEVHDCARQGSAIDISMDAPGCLSWPLVRTEQQATRKSYSHCYANYPKLNPLKVDISDAALLVHEARDHDDYGLSSLLAATHGIMGQNLRSGLEVFDRDYRASSMALGRFLIPIS